MPAIVRRVDPGVRNVTLGVLGSIVAIGVAGALLPNGLPFGVVLLGVVLGALSSLTAMGLVLIYRSARVVNFAQVEIGGLAATVAVILVTGLHVPYLLALPLGLASALGTGAVIETTVVKRFFKAPRLILTVATIGVAELLGAAELGLPSLFPHLSSLTTFTTPFTFTFHVGPIVFNGNDLLVLIVVPVVLGGLWWFFGRTDLGIAIRGAADSAERASLLGIPVRRLSLTTWMVAAGLSGIASMLSAPILGPQLGVLAGPSLLLAPLAAAVVGQMESLPVTFFAALGIGVFEQAVFWSYPNSSFVDVALFVLVLGALLVKKRRRTRVDDAGLGGYVAFREVRPIPAALRRLPEVRAARVVGLVALVVVVLVLPTMLASPKIVLLSYMAIYAIIAVSLVVLTGWAGQISLGQFAFVGVGAATTAALLVHVGADFLLAILASAAVGAVVAIVIGIPALRVQGLFLAVVTLAFAVPVSSYLLNSAYFPVLTPSLVPRPNLFDRISLDSPLAFYFFCVLVLGLMILVARNFRRSRAGRAVVAARDNERGAGAYGISARRARLAAFALSGALAGVAGSLYTVGLRGIGFSGFNPEKSLVVFTMVVVGGLGSLPGALLGAVYVEAAQYFLTGAAQLLATGAGLLVLLMVAPGGLGELLYGARDGALRRLARLHQLSVPSLAETPAFAQKAGQALDPERLAIALTTTLTNATTSANNNNTAVTTTTTTTTNNTTNDDTSATTDDIPTTDDTPTTKLPPPSVEELRVLLDGIGGLEGTPGPCTGSPGAPLDQAATAPWTTHDAQGAARFEDAGAFVDTAVLGRCEPSAPPMLRCSKVDARYGMIQVLFDVELVVERGEVLALLGTNGAGKSTALKVLSGLISAGGGRVELDGKDITDLDPVERVKAGLVLVPGGHGVFGSLSVAENLRLAGWLRRADRHGLASATAGVLELFPALRTRLSTRASDLSGGEQQMLTIAQALLCRPKLIMIDELSLGLAPTVVADLMGVVRTLAEQGTTVLVVEQSLNVATSLAPRAIFMERGQVRFSGSTAELHERPELARSIFLASSTPRAPGGPEAVLSDGARSGDGLLRESAEREPAHGLEELLDPPVFEVRDVSLRYGGVSALRGVTLHADRGEILGIIGANGAGKTTLFDVCSGFVEPDSGLILLDGSDISGLSAFQRSRYGLGRLFQDARLFPSMTVAEALAVSLDRHTKVRDPFACALGLGAVLDSEEEVRARVAQMLQIMGLERYQDAFIAELSTGTRRIVELAGAMAHNPEVLLLDEPSSGIAQRESEALGELIVQLREDTGATMIIIEHDVPLVSSLADRLICMHLGQVIAQGPPAEVLADPLVVASYLGTDEVAIARSGPSTPPAPAIAAGISETS